MGRFSAKREYRTLRAEDKKAVIDFRGTLYELRHRKDGLSMTELRRAVEGFSKFLEAMQAINQREVLVIHDRKLLEESLGRLEAVTATMATDIDAASAAMAQLIESLWHVHGRHPDLDEALRDYRDNGGGAGSLAADIQTWMPLLQGTLAVVG